MKHLLYILREIALFSVIGTLFELVKSNLFLVYLSFPACIKYNIPRLVYTSTFNVVFGGQTIENGDESLPYFPIDKVN